MSQTQQSSLLPYYEGWGRYNQILIDAIESLTLEQLALRTTPQHWSIGMYMTHIIANRAWWFHARMGEGGDEMTAFELWALGVAEADIDPQHTAAELVDALQKTWQMIEEVLEHLTAADLTRLVAPMDDAERVRHVQMVEPALQPYGWMWVESARQNNEVRPPVSFQWIIWHVLEHDIHHGSEISTTLGIYGLPVIELE
jgi:uncharacterized damage-inducible protein DinB